MHDKIRAAFGEIHAEEELKNRTRAYIAQQMSARRKPSGRMRLIPVLACCLFVLLAGWGGGCLLALQVAGYVGTWIL